MTRIALLIAACLAALVSAVAVADADNTPLGSIFEDISDFPSGPNGVDVCWGGDGTENVDHYTIQRAKGTQPPPSDSPPIATVEGKTGCYEALGLATGEPYTFRIVGRNEAGDSQPGTITVAARE